MDWLPTDHSVESYIDACLSLIEEWGWLVRERTVDILKSELLDQPPASEVLTYISELNVEDLNEVPYGFTKDEWPVGLKKFVKECHSLKISIPKKEFQGSNLDSSLFRGMSSKKQHEVIQLSSLIAEKCIELGIHHVVDFGSGLGYVDRILHQHYGLSVLGLEMDLEKVKKAQQLCSGVDYKQVYLSEDNIPELIESIREWLQGSPACFTALHACGDLSVHIGNVFAGVIEGKCLVMIPCCYHRSNLRPLSEEVQRSQLINTVLLRLASDGTSERWRNNSEEDHLSHARSVLARALVELFPSQESGDVRKKFRHLLRSDARQDWSKCLTSCLERFPGVEREKLLDSWETNKWRLSQVEAYTCLQVCLQGVVEGLVLADTFLFLTRKSKGFVKLYRVFDVIKSPRSVAFVVNS